MRAALAALALIAAPAAFAQPMPDKPDTAPPSASAPFAARENWCAAYTAWFVSVTSAEGAAPTDARPTQRFETEFDSCKLDPQAYERQTRAEIPADTVST